VGYRDAVGRHTSRDARVAFLDVRAELRSLDCADATEGLETFQPPDPERFRLAIGAVIGPAGEPGGDLFYFDVTTGSWLADDRPPKDFEFARQLRLTRWDYDVVWRAIADLARRAEGDTWAEITAKLSRHAAWEFEDYRP
jgi:immunity protein 8 of polymorphic toxin system